MFLIFKLYLPYSGSYYYFRCNLDCDGREHETTVGRSLMAGTQKRKKEIFGIAGSIIHKVS